MQGDLLPGSQEFSTIMTDQGIRGKRWATNNPSYGTVKSTPVSNTFI
jgi:hypothetical protein